MVLAQLWDLFLGHCSPASFLVSIEVSANLTQCVGANKISSSGKVVLVILKLGEQDWKITQLGTDTSHIKYSQMEQTTQN